MADIAESAQFTDPLTAISHGKRHLLVRDYTMAVTALAQACQLLAEKHGDTADELGEPYLLYGRALLGLAREEAGVLGGAVPGTEDGNEDEEEEDDEGEEEKLSNVDEKEEDDEEEDEERASNGTSGEAKDTANTSESKTDDSKAAEEAAKLEEGKKEEKPETEAGKGEAKGPECNKTDDKKIAEQVAQKQKAVVVEKENVTPGSSKESEANGPSSSEQNGDLKENGKEDSEDLTKDEQEEEEEVNNLQVAWEVLELAKLVLLKRGQAGWKLLADAYRLLGEVAMEGGNYQGALNDLHGCLDLLQKIEPREPRAIAEIHYQLALAHSLGNEFDASIEQFNNATSLLEGRIKELEEMKDPPKSDDSFYTVEGEIKELKELLPEIQEKISDMKDFKQEACKLVIEGIKSKVAGGCSNGAGPSSSSSDSGTSSSPKVQKPASDISHLVRKKRKAEEPETEVAQPTKKPTPEKAV